MPIKVIKKTCSRIGILWSNFHYHPHGPVCPKSKRYIRVFIVNGIYVTLDPGSVHMGIFGFLLKLLKPIYSPLNKLVKIFEGHHKVLTEDYNFPTLVSFAIIIIASRWFSVTRSNYNGA